MRRLLARVPLMARFSLLSLLIVAAIGLAIGFALHARTQTRALSEAQRLGEVLAGTAGSTALRPQDMAGPVSAERAAELDRELAGPLRRSGVEAVKLYNHEGTIVYASDHAQIGEQEAEGAELAASGETHRELGKGTADDGEGERTLSVYVPLTVPGTSAADRGVLEVYLPYAPVAATIRHDTEILVGLLALGLLVLWLSLFRLVSSASARLHRQAREDHLTGLPNRTELHAAGRRLLASGPEDRLAALLLIDLDRFKEINDTLGHHQGDELLREVAERLRGIVRPTDVLARLGGDEFAILVRDLPHRGATAEVSARVKDALARPFHLAGVALELDASIGVALHPDHGTDIPTLLQRADVAMYCAKQGGAGIETYDRTRDPYSPERLRLVADLRRAVEREEFVLHFQPKIAVATGEVTGAEALVRWNHPTRGLLGPIEFVPLAERTGVIGALTRWVLDAALAQCAAWRAAGLELPVAVNLSGTDVLDTGLADMVGDALERAGIPGHLLECEISEHTVLAEPRRAAESLGRLREMGVRLSLDDFGQGQSSLSYLKRLPLDELKIDRSFVMGMETDASDAAIVRATVDLGRGLGLRVVAEGVESDEVLAGLAALSCDVAQGFGLSRPLPADELETWLAGRAIARPAQTA